MHTQAHYCTVTRMATISNFLICNVLFTVYVIAIIWQVGKLLESGEGCQEFREQQHQAYTSNVKMKVCSGQWVGLCLSQKLRLCSISFHTRCCVAMEHFPNCTRQSPHGNAHGSMHAYFAISFHEILSLLGEPLFRSIIQMFSYLIQLVWDRGAQLQIIE